MIQIKEILEFSLEEILITDQKYYLGAAKTQLHNTYIISQSKDSVIITDQHAAHERLGYEKIKEQIKKKGVIRQRLLIPEIIELSSKEKAEVIDDNKKSLLELGLSIEKFGEKSIIVSEIPSLLGDINIIKLVKNLDLGSFNYQTSFLQITVFYNSGKCRIEWVQ